MGSMQAATVETLVRPGGGQEQRWGPLCLPGACNIVE